MARFGRRGSYAGGSYGYGGGYGYGGFAPYVPVATRRVNAIAHARQIAKKEHRELAPVKIATRKIATTFWGKAWCENLEAYSDFANRLPRGRTYARNGSVIDLQISKGKIAAIVSGSDIYDISIEIKPLAKTPWERLKVDCSRSIGSLIDLLQGRFDAGVMQRLVDRDSGLFPRPQEMTMSCSCPDYASLCKHLAAVLYAVGNRLDSSPEILFTLRNVDHLELIGQAVSASSLDSALDGVEAGESILLATSDLGEIFGIEIVESAAPKKAKRGGKKAASATIAATKAIAATKTTRRKQAPPKKRASASKPKATVTSSKRKAR